MKAEGGRINEQVARLRPSFFVLPPFFPLSARKGTAYSGFGAGLQPLALRSLIGLPHALLRHGLFMFVVCVVLRSYIDTCRSAAWFQCFVALFLQSFQME